MERSLNCSRLVTVSPHLKKKHACVSLMKNKLEIHEYLHVLGSSDFPVNIYFLIILFLLIKMELSDVQDKAGSCNFFLMF